MKRCPPGVICLENATMIFLLICVIAVGYFVYTRLNQPPVVIQNNRIQRNFMSDSVRNNSVRNDDSLDVLRNPYSPPLNDERYFQNESRGLPINMSTTAVDSTFRQVGILTPLNGSSKDSILPLMGKILFTRRDLWNYYTISNQHNNVKLPVSVKGRSALNEHGVDKVFDGDTVYVDGMNQPYKATIYENTIMRYLPAL
jgi:hypothetical protein